MNITEKEIKEIIEILNDELEVDREFNIILNKEKAAKAILDKIKEKENLRNEDLSTIDINVEIGRQLKRLRKSRNITQAELGKKLKMSHANISDMEHGKTKLTIENLLIYQIIFGKENVEDILKVIFKKG
uniref:Putative DNA binding, helix-turn-helix domain containing protein n=1 Tax=viral metagenome TaxID=1070528 RepID=A0A6H1ZD18_9ZZZZ